MMPCFQICFQAVSPLSALTVKKVKNGNGNKGNMICCKAQSHSYLYHFEPLQPLTLKQLPGDVKGPGIWDWAYI